MPWEWLAPVATAFAGVAGVAGTVYVSRQGRSAQVELAKAQASGGARQALIAEKRSFYAGYLRAVDEAVDKAAEVTLLDRMRREATSKAAGRELESRLDKAQHECAESFDRIRRMLPELMILGGHWIGSMASVVMMLAFQFARGESPREAILPAQTELIALMHESVNPDGELLESAMEERVRPWFKVLDMGKAAEAAERLAASYPDGHWGDKAASIRRLADSS
ncbi:hypothetical protein [Micromonospora sp. BL1]|uniref:hypothetical protein n=1 Tax=Micromonospora sp. BL1 TaxID=2478709 RepID=UPI0011C4025A|nr:hypothetical protein [Micromonospora sp. BL1]